MIKLSFFYEDEEITADFPSHKVVCPICNGNGCHVNSAIDGNGLSYDNFQDPDFAGDYLSGKYDVLCTECNGNNVIDEIDYDNADPELLRKYTQYLKEEAADRAYAMAERRMGA